MWFWCQSFETDTNVSTNEDKKYTGRLLYPMYGHSTYMRNEQNVLKNTLILELTTSWYTKESHKSKCDQLDKLFTSNKARPLLIELING